MEDEQTISMLMGFSIANCKRLPEGSTLGWANMCKPPIRDRQPVAAVSRETRDHRASKESGKCSFKINMEIPIWREYEQESWLLVFIMFIQYPLSMIFRLIQHINIVYKPLSFECLSPGPQHIFCLDKTGKVHQQNRWYNGDIMVV
jgi:hypothetical protein